MEAGVRKNLSVAGMVLLLASLITNGVFVSKNYSLETERNNAILVLDSTQAVKQLLTKEYDDVKNTLGKVLGKNAELDQAVLALNSELDQQKDKVNRLTKENASVVSLRKQLAEAKKLRKDCETEVNRLLHDSEKSSNKMNELMALNTSLQTQLGKMSLMLEAAKDLKVYNLDVRKYKVKKNKAVPTSKARRTERITVSFDIIENQVADAGQKKMYAVITDPKGETLLMENKTFFNKKAGKETTYSAMKEVEYSKSEQRVTISFDYDNKLKGGKYKVELFADGAYAGKGEFMLK